MKRKVSLNSLEIISIDEGNTKNGAELVFTFSAGTQSFRIEENKVYNGAKISVDRSLSLELEKDDKIRILWGGFEADNKISRHDQLAGGGMILSSENNFGIPAGSSAKYSVIGANKNGEYVVHLEISE